MPGGQRGVRRRLYERDPHCHWCGRLTVFEPPRNHVTTPADLGTIDHLRPRYHPGRRVVPKPGERRLVLACFECNQRRNHEDFLALPKEIRRAMTLDPRPGRQSHRERMRERLDQLAVDR